MYGLCGRNLGAFGRCLEAAQGALDDHCCAIHLRQSLHATLKPITISANTAVHISLALPLNSHKIGDAFKRVVSCFEMRHYRGYRPEVQWKLLLLIDNYTSSQPRSSPQSMQCIFGSRSLEYHHTLP